MSSSENDLEINASAIKDALKKQVEFYFSPENLARDRYLQDLMSKDQIVPIDEICKFPKVLKICSNNIEILKKYLIESLEESKICIITNDKLGIKPLPKPKVERNTIILRDIPSSTNSDLLLQCFSIPNGKEVQSIHCDIGDTWFVTMLNEADAIVTMKAIQSNKIKFNDQPMKARLKSAVTPRITGGQGGGGPPPPSPQHNHHNQTSNSSNHHQAPYALRPTQNNSYPYQMGHMNQRNVPYMNGYETGYGSSVQYYQQPPRSAGRPNGYGGGYQVPSPVYTNMPQQQSNMRPGYPTANSSHHHSPRANMPELQMMGNGVGMPTYQQGGYTSPNSQMKMNQNRQNQNQNNYQSKHTNQSHMNRSSPKYNDQQQSQKGTNNNNNNNNNNNGHRGSKNTSTQEQQQVNHQNNKTLIMDETPVMDVNIIEQQMNINNGTSPSPSSQSANPSSSQCRGDELIKQLSDFGDLGQSQKTQPINDSTEATNHNNTGNNGNNNNNNNKKKGKDKNDKEDKKTLNNENKKTKAKKSLSPLPNFSSFNFPPLGGQDANQTNVNTQLPSPPPLTNEKRMTAAEIVAGTSTKSSSKDFKDEHVSNTLQSQEEGEVSIETKSTMNNKMINDDKNTMVIDTGTTTTTATSQNLQPSSTDQEIVKEVKVKKEEVEIVKEDNENDVGMISFGTVDKETSDENNATSKSSSTQDRVSPKSVIEKKSSEGASDVSDSTIFKMKQQEEEEVPTQLKAEEDTPTPTPTVWGKTSFSEVVKRQTK